VTLTQQLHELARLAGQVLCDICDCCPNERITRRSAVGDWSFCRECFRDVKGQQALDDLERSESFARSMAAAKTPKEKQLVMLASMWGGFR
jgi:ribosomal protein L37AE/L43A